MRVGKFETNQGKVSVKRADVPVCGVCRESAGLGGAMSACLSWSVVEREVS